MMGNVVQDLRVALVEAGSPAAATEQLVVAFTESALAELWRLSIAAGSVAWGRA
jgi:hypothetical protein